MLISELRPGDRFRTTITRRTGKVFRVDRHSAQVVWDDRPWKTKNVHINLVVEDVGEEDE